MAYKFKYADLCSEHRTHLGAGKSAVVVRSILEYGMARMWFAYIEGRWDVTCNIFRSLDDAIVWLT